MLPTIVNPRELSAPNIKVVDDEGNEIVRPDVITAVVQLAQLAQLVRIRKSLEREHVEGKQDSKVLACTGSPQVIDLIMEEPFRAWATASFINDTGSDTAYIGINSRRSPATLKEGEPYQADFTKADRRIELIYYWTNPGEFATIRAVGKY